MRIAPSTPRRFRSSRSSSWCAGTSATGRATLRGRRTIARRATSRRACSRRSESRRSSFLLPRAEHLLELVGRRDLELVVAAFVGPLVGPPAHEDRGMAKAVALQVVVLHLAHALDAQRLPRQILARAPAALR